MLSDLTTNCKHQISSNKVKTTYYTTGHLEEQAVHWLQSPWLHLYPDQGPPDGVLRPRQQVGHGAVLRGAKFLRGHALSWSKFFSFYLASWYRDSWKIDFSQIHYDPYLTAHQCKEFSTQGDCTVTIIGWTFSEQPIPAQYWQGKSTIFPDHPVHWSSQFGRLGTKLGSEYSIP